MDLRLDDEAHTTIGVRLTPSSLSTYDTPLSKLGLVPPCPARTHSSLSNRDLPLPSRQNRSARASLPSLSSLDIPSLPVQRDIPSLSVQTGHPFASCSVRTDSPGHPFPPCLVRTGSSGHLFASCSVRTDSPGTSLRFLFSQNRSAGTSLSLPSVHLVQMPAAAAPQQSRGASSRRQWSERIVRSAAEQGCVIPAAVVGAVARLIVGPPAAAVTVCGSAAGGPHTNSGATAQACDTGV